MPGYLQMQTNHNHVVINMIGFCKTKKTKKNMYICILWCTVGDSCSALWDLHRWKPKNLPVGGLGRLLWQLRVTRVSANERSMRKERRTRGLKRAGWWHDNKQSKWERRQSGGNYLADWLVWKHCPCPCAKKQCHNKVKEYCLFKWMGGQTAAVWRRETRKEEWSNQRQRSQYKHSHYR